MCVEAHACGSPSRSVVMYEGSKRDITNAGDRHKDQTSKSGISRLHIRDVLLSVVVSRNRA